MGDFNYCPLCKYPSFNKIMSFGDIPLVNSLNDTQNKYPLNLYFCPNCGLVFINTPKTPIDIFSNYSYFSSWSSTWVAHCRRLFWKLAEGNLIHKDSFIVEIASNDGYMLRNFKENGYKDVLGIEPAENVAASAIKGGIPTIADFFTQELADRLSETKKADCIIALNVLAHVPDIMKFMSGIKTLLSNDGFSMLEFHHLLSLVEKKQFDTIYHEHFSYLSLYTVEYVINQIGLRVFRVEKIPTQGGSLRIYLSHRNDSAIKKYPIEQSVENLRQEEYSKKLKTLGKYDDFASNAYENIDSSRDFILDLIDSGKSVAGYGAAAKAVIFINVLGLDEKQISCVADINPVKQDSNIPGTEIPVVSPAELIESAPDYVIIFPWNLKDEISSELKDIDDGGTRFIVFTPGPEIFE